MSEQPPDATAEVDVDPRITFASERTFLDTRQRVIHLFIALAPIVLGGFLASIGYRRWRAFDAALKSGSPLPVDSMLRSIAILIAALAVGAAVVSAVWILD